MRAAQRVKNYEAIAVSVGIDALAPTTVFKSLTSRSQFAMKN
jgi:hypothetical protein